VDLAANTAEDPHLTVRQGRPQLRLFAGESDEFRRTLERDDARG